MSKLQDTLKRIDLNINNMKPKTMDDFIDTVHNTAGNGDYGTHYTIVSYDNEIKGVRVYVTGNSISHPLPGVNQYYSLTKGLEKYIAAGWKVEELTQLPRIYKVYKVGRISRRRTILERNLTEPEAKRVVAQHPESSRSMVCYTKQ